MAITVEAVYENGALKLEQPLPLQEHAKVKVTVHVTTPLAESTGGAAAGVIPCTDPQLIDWAATDPELDYPPPAGHP
jgi:predicted DNA-binding antitoxin AbrB/MazE fold protein